MMESIMRDPRLRSGLDPTRSRPAAQLLAMLHRSRATTWGAALLFSLAVAATGCTRADPRSALVSTGSPVPSFAPLVREVMPAVVNVSAVRRIDRTAAGRQDRDTGLSDERSALQDPPPEVLDEFLRRLLDPRG